MLDEFELKEEHIKLLKHSFIITNDCEFGSSSIDPKRPYGNGNVLEDISEILDVQPEYVSIDEEKFFSLESEAYMNATHFQLEIALQIVLCTTSFVPGLYIKTEEYNSLSWKLKNEKTKNNK